jgi:hypothetical protein
MMTDRYALVGEDGQVENVVLWDGQTPWEPPAGQTPVQVEREVAIGWRLEDGQWIAPQEAA